MNSCDENNCPLLAFSASLTMYYRAQFERAVTIDIDHER